MKQADMVDSPMTKSPVKTGEVAAALRYLADLTASQYERREALMAQSSASCHGREQDYLICSLTEYISSFRGDQSFISPAMGKLLSSWLNFQTRNRDLSVRRQQR